MTTHVWHSGPPPEIGWWPASFAGDPESIRWWNGVCWSLTAWPEFDSDQAAYRASIKELSPKQIKWTERWWL